jgi:hypothetical protein
VVKSDKTPGALHDYLIAFYIVDSEIHRLTTIQKINHCDFSMAELSILSLYLSCPFPLCTNNQYINNMGVHSQTQLYSSLMLLCYVRITILTQSM